MNTKASLARALPSQFELETQIEAASGHIAGHAPQHSPAFVPQPSLPNHVPASSSSTPGNIPGAGLDARQRIELLKLEQDIANRYHTLGQRQTWPYVLGTLIGFPLWLSLFPLAMLHILPPQYGFFIASFLFAAGWVAGHEAMHSNIGRYAGKGSFWNEVTGHLALIPVLYPFSLARITHLEHHRHCNDPLRDPDYPVLAPTFREAVIKFWRNRQPGPSGHIHHVRRIMVALDTPEATRALKVTLFMQLAGHAFFIGMALSGYAIEAALLWWAPRWVALFFIHIGLGWDPHHAATGPGRYENTRIFRSKFGKVLSMGIEGHLMHHLYPHIPMHLTKRALREMRPVLEPRGVDFSEI